MEGSIYNTCRLLQTDSNVLWNDKLTSHIPGKGKVVAFVDDMLVGTEIEERYNEIVEEILKRLEENDLYVKLEKCV